MVLFRLWGFIDYGRSLARVGLAALIAAEVFALIFLLWPGMLRYEDWTPNSWYTPFYYSIVTYTTLGFGDVTPRTVGGMVVVTIEVILGYVTLGLLISILANKVARRA